MSSDRSSGSRTLRIQAKTLATFHINNPNAKEDTSQFGFDHERYLQRRLGQIPNVISGIPITTDAPCCDIKETSCPTQITNFRVVNFFSPSPPYDSYAVGYTFAWDPIPNSELGFSTTSDGTWEFVDQTSSSVILYTTSTNPLDVSILITPNGCTSLTSTLTNIFPCFLAGSLVSLADGSTKPIEDVQVGDLVVGAFGEINTVLALHRPLLGVATMTQINGEHATSSHHPHISLDKKFYAPNPARLHKACYGQEHKVINAEGEEVMMMLYGLKEGRTQVLGLGVELKTIEGSRIVKSLELLGLPPETQLYNLVVGGSHTYHVDGYAVTGWPREDDFDYDSWSSTK
jgi:hypothetical protein